MEIFYGSTKLEKLLTDYKKLVKKYGEQAAVNIIQRMNELNSADNLTLLPPAARVHPREPRNQALFSVDVLKHKHPLRLLFHAEGEFDLSNYKTIIKIRIDKIEQIHS